MFLCRILNKDFIQSSGSGVSITDVKEALDFRHSYTRELMTSLIDAFDAQSSKLKELANALDVIPSAEGEDSGETEMSVQPLLSYPPSPHQPLK